MRNVMIFLTVAGLLLAGSVTARAEDFPAAERQAIQGVISQQIEAFRHDDGTAAFGFATPELQTMFGDQNRFMGMVRDRFQPVYRPRSFVFGALEMLDGAPVQEVGLIGPDGLPHTAVYSMERQADGTWKIAACRLVERPSVES